MDERDVLAVDPFEGDFGEPGDAVLSDKMVTARKETPCHICTQPTIKGSRIRVKTDRIDGEIATYRFCQKCCEAMALSWKDEGVAIESRWALREARGEE